MKKILALLALTIALLMCLVACSEQTNHNHDFGEWLITRNATCTENGVKTRYCECGEKQDDAISAIGHSHKILSAVESTCSKNGLTEGVGCYSCGKILIAQQKTPLKAHVEQIIPAVDSTCFENGLTEGKLCANCGKILIAQQEAPLKAHTEVIDMAVAATCIKEGLTEGKHCTVCGTITVTQQATPVIAHTYDDKYDETCNKCGYIRDAECPHLEIEIINGYAATCTSAGLTDGTKCKKCCEILTSQVAINIVPHLEFIDAAIESTCISTGLTEGKHCSACGTILGAQTVIPAKGHIEVVDLAVAETCTSSGLTEGKHCSTCNEITVEQTYIPALGHSESDWIIEKYPTSIEDGYKYKKCYRCGNKTEEIIIPALENIGLDCEIDGATITITGIGTFSGTELVIPAYISGYKVTAIGENAFSECAVLTKIVLPDTIESIGTRAFYGCTGITEITIPESVSDIGTQIFYKASNLTTVYYNGTYSSKSNQFLNLSHITKLVFGGSYVPSNICCDNTAVITVEILEGVESIESGAFYGCTRMTEIKISDTVTSIGSSVFYNCSSLTSVIIPDSVTSIGNSAFSNCSSLTSVVIGDSVTSIGSSAFYGCESLTSVVIPDSVTSIGSYAFFQCYNLESVYLTDIKAWCGISISSNFSNPMCYGADLYLNGEIVTDLTIPDSVTSLSDYTFYGCTSLTSIVIPDSVTSIGAGAFYYCSNLNSITLPFVGGSKDGADNTHFGYIFGAPSYSDNSSFVPSSLQSVTVTGGTNISNYAFYGCKDLASAVIPDTVTSIGASAFYNCSSLISVVIPDSVTSIAASAFYNCYSLTSVVIPDSVTSIGASAFYGCLKLVEVVNKSVLNITAGSSAYGNIAYYAKEVHNVESKIANKDDYLFYTYGGVDYLIGYIGDASDLILPESYNGRNYSIYDYAFYKGTCIRSIVIPEGVISVGNEAFLGCSGLTSITLPFVGESKDGTDNTHFGYIFGAPSSSGNSSFVPSSLQSVTVTGGTNIFNYAFSGCKDLTSIVIPDSVTNIGERAFSGCDCLTSIFIPESVTSIGDYAFSGCDRLTSIFIPESVTIIGNYAFYGCSGLTSVVIPNSVISIGNNAFRDCTSLTSVVIPENVTSIDYSAFYNCTNLTKVEIAANSKLTSIRTTVFSGCKSLTDVVIPDSVTSIGNGAFEYCSSLTSVVIGDSVISIGDTAFYKCSSLTNVVIGDSVTSIDRCAFEYCFSLTDIKYRGTQSQWNAITKGYNWNYGTGKCTITYNYDGE